MEDQDFLQGQEDAEVIGASTLLEERGIEYEGNIEVEDETELEVETPKRVVQPAQPEPQPDKRPIRNADARARVLEREKRELQLSLRETNDRLARLEQSLLANRQQPTPDDEEELPDENDPIALIQYEQRKTRELLERDRQEKEQAQVQQAQQQNFVNALVHANNEIDVFAGVVGDYNSSVEFLEQRLTEFIQDENPGYNQAETKQALQTMVAQTKLWALQQNRNPGEVFYKTALRYGYRRPEQTQQQQAPVEDARKVIRDQKDKESKSRTLSTTQGHAGKGRIQASKLPTKDLDRYITEQIKSGDMKRGSAKDMASALLSHKKDAVYDDGRS